MNATVRGEGRMVTPRWIAALLEFLATAQGRRWLLRGLLAYAVIGTLVWIRRPGDFAGYLAVGELALTGGHIYRDAPPGVNTWPPLFSVMSVPLALLARPTPYLARGVWLILNLGLVLLALDLIARLIYGRALSLRAEPTAGLSLAAPEVLVPFALSDRFVSGNFDHLQINLVIFVLALSGLYLQWRGRELSGSLILGLSAAIKVMPVVFVPYLAYRGRWRAAIYTALATAAWSLSPIAVFGWTRFWDYVVAWRGMLGAGFGVGKMNQSAFAMWDRFLGHGMVPFRAAIENYVPESGSRLVLVVAAATVLVVTALALWLFRGDAERADWATAAEWSAVFIVSVLFGPVMWKAYLVVLLLPNTLLFAAWRSPHIDAVTRRRIGWVLVVTVALGALPSPGVVGKTLAATLEMASAVTISTLIVLGATFWFRARLRALPAVG